MVRPSLSGMRTSDFLASSVALRMASGTSRALPWPKPTRPFWSPTTTRAAKPKRRPPLTTFATRLMCTSLSLNSLSRSSRSRDLSLWGRATSLVPLLELQSAFARTVGQRLDAAMILVGSPVEHNVADTGSGRPLRQQLADLGRGGLVGAGLQLALHLLLETGGSRHRAALGVVDQLGIDVLRRAVHRQPRLAARIVLEIGADAPLAPVGLVQLAQHGAPLTSSCLPCGRCTRPGSARPCPGRARAGAMNAARRRTAPPSACRCLTR